MPLTFEEVSNIVSIIDKSSCDELVVEADDIRLVIRRSSHGREAARPSTDPAAAAVGAAVTPAPQMPAAAPQPAPAAAARPGQVAVAAPMVGTFYRSPAPDKPAFVTEGAAVREGDPLCLIEVMKLFTTVYAAVGGRVEWVLPEDGALVEFGQTLFVIAPT